eukprot:5310988-Amphidinium_carterae.1
MTLEKVRLTRQVLQTFACLFSLHTLPASQHSCQLMCLEPQRILGRDDTHKTLHCFTMPTTSAPNDVPNDVSNDDVTIVLAFLHKFAQLLALPSTTHSKPTRCASMEQQDAIN